MRFLFVPRTFSNGRYGPSRMPSTFPESSVRSKSSVAHWALTSGTDLQKHGSMKDAQTILRHKHIKTTAEVYMDHIPDSVSRAIEARTDAIFALRNKRRRRKSTGVLLNIAGQSKGKVSVN
jgi:hypothetical protein